MDLWWSRMFARLSGQVIQRDEGRVARFRSALRDLVQQGVADGHEYGYNLGEAVQNDAKLDAYARSVSYRARNAESRNALPDELRRAANTLFAELNHTAADPAGPTDRMWQRSVISRLQELLKADGHEVSIADLQALLWYHEKQLYRKLGNTNAQAEPTDYAKAARLVTEQYRPERTHERLGRGEPGSYGVSDIHKQPAGGGEEEKNAETSPRYSRNWRDQLTPEQKAATDKIGSPKPLSFVQRVKETLTHVKNSWRQGIIDQYDSLRKLDVKAHGEDVFDHKTQLSSWVLARLSGNE